MLSHIASRHGQIIKFLISGVTAAAVEYTIFIIMHGVFGIDAIASQTTSFLIGFVISFLLNKHWVFRSKGGAKSELLRYGILAGVNVILSNAVVYGLLSVGVAYWITKFIVMALVATWNYVIFQKIIFNATRH